MSENSNKITYGFKTKGTWTINDLTLLSTSIGNIYDLFLSKNIYKKAPGIGEILKEIREMVKDLWYRNKQEKTKGELEIIKRYLGICRENEEINVPMPKYLQKRNILIDETYKNIKQLKELESQIKLANVGENIDYIPE